MGDDYEDDEAVQRERRRKGEEEGKNSCGWADGGVIKGTIRGSLGHKIKSKMNAVISKYDIVQHFPAACQ